MDRKSKKLTLVGYQAKCTNYRLWDPQTNKITMSRDVTFNEDSKKEKATQLSTSPGIRNVSYKSYCMASNAPRCWNRKFHTFLKGFKFNENSADSCVYRAVIEKSIVYLALFVDDDLIISSSKKSIEIVLDNLKKVSNLTISKISLFVGMQIELDRINKTLFIHQSSYTLQILRKFRMIDIKPVSVPTDPHTTLSELDHESINVPFREDIGSLMFFALVIRSDITHAVNVVSRYTNNYKRSH